MRSAPCSAMPPSRLVSRVTHQTKLFACFVSLALPMDSVQQPPFPVIPKASHVTIGVRRTMHPRQSISSVCATELKSRVSGVLPIRNLPHPVYIISETRECCWAFGRGEAGRVHFPVARSTFLGLRFSHHWMVHATYGLCVGILPLSDSAIRCNDETRLGWTQQRLRQLPGAAICFWDLLFFLGSSKARGGTARQPATFLNQAVSQAFNLLILPGESCAHLTHHGGEGGLLL